MTDSCMLALTRAASEALDLPPHLAACWSEALDAAENAVIAAELARTLPPAELAHWRARLWRERDWLRRQLALGSLSVLAFTVIRNGRQPPSELRIFAQARSAPSPMSATRTRARLGVSSEMEEQ